MTERNANTPRLTILVVSHSERAPGGHFCSHLERLGGVLQWCVPGRGDELPRSPADFDGLVVLGGPQHAGDDAQSPHFPVLMRLMRDCEQEVKPVAGICLGCQLLARAHGCRVTRLGYLEFGFIQHRLTAEGQRDPLTGGGMVLPQLMEFHEDSFELPDGASLLVEGGGRCRNQCFRVGKASYGFQFHLEVDAATLAIWLELFRDGAIPTYRGYREQIGEEYLDHLRENSAQYLKQSTSFCNEVAGRWLELVRRNA